MNSSRINRVNLFPYLIILFTVLFISCQSTPKKSELTRIEQLKPEIPKVLSPNIQYEGDRIVLKTGNNTYYLKSQSADFSLINFTNPAQGTSKGFAFDFGLSGFSGELHYGFIPENDGIRAQPVFYRYTEKIKNGKAEINIKDNLTGRYDIINWVENKRGVLGYRITDSVGQIIYDGKFYFKENGSFEVATSITEGPMLSIVTPINAFISFKTNEKIIAKVKVNNTEFSSDSAGYNHIIHLTGLNPDKEYPYTIEFGENTFTSSFKSAPEPGGRKPFTFAFASDGRQSRGGGERDMFGVNKYITKKVFAYSVYRNSAFFQFTGDLISGYRFNRDQIKLEYSNWKRTIEPFSHTMPIYVGFGNHESLCLSFDDGSRYGLSVDKFPYGTLCSESLFDEMFVMPNNGPQSEDNMSYDPDRNEINFPSYKGNVYFYTYDNVAVVVLNSNYWYSPSRTELDKVGGNLHGYIMDKQFGWLRETMEILERTRDVDHVFITLHTPIFPNGGHVKDCMWYNGNNEMRPWVAGKPVEFGIIERRDQILNAIINSSTKVRAVLTGDEHNYSRTLISSEMEMYPGDWDKQRINIRRPIWQITNGSAGAPYYAQEQTPWSSQVRKFSVQYAVCLFHIDGESIILEVVNPDTLELIEKVDLNKF